MTFIVMVVVAVVVGAIAQSWKRRTGFFWGLLALILQVGTMAVFIWADMTSGMNTLETSPNGFLALQLLSVGIGGVVSLVIVATLPVRSAKG